MAEPRIESRCFDSEPRVMLSPHESWLFSRSYPSLPHNHSGTYQYCVLNDSDKGANRFVPVSLDNFLNHLICFTAQTKILPFSIVPIASPGLFSIQSLSGSIPFYVLICPLSVCLPCRISGTCGCMLLHTGLSTVPDTSQASNKYLLNK